MKTAQLATLYFLFLCLLGILPVAASAQPYTISTDGSEVTDQATGLVWRRCAEGLVGSTCTGTALTFTHEKALVLAMTESARSATAWRLPNVKELASIADKSLLNPAIDTAAFPATPTSYYFWSSSPFVSDPVQVWIVAFIDGRISMVTRDTSYFSFFSYVRLVRAGQ